jgi:hypothetical protein
VNGYYRSLGIDWPWKPTKKELRQGYQAVGGPEDDRLTYYFKQLLDRDIRAEYDAMPLGSRYRDKYAIEKDMHRLSDLASKLSGETGEVVTVNDLIDEYESANDRRSPEPVNLSTLAWNWGFYSLKSRKWGTDDLVEWQRLLIDSFAKRGVEVVIALGYTGHSGKNEQPFLIRHHDGREVFFLNENTTPTAELAETAVSMFMAHRQKGKE